MALSILMRLPCELLLLIGQYLTPTDLENYLLVLQQDLKSQLDLTDFTIVTTRPYSSLANELQLQLHLEASKLNPYALTKTRLSFTPDRVQITLVNRVRHGLAHFYRASELVAYGHYRNGLKEGHWVVRQNYHPDLRWTELDYSEKGNYHNDQREGTWAIQGLNSIKSILGGASGGASTGQSLVLQTRVELNYYHDHKSGPGVFTMEDIMVDNGGIISRTITGTQRGEFREDKLEGDWLYVSSRNSNSRILFNYRQGRQINFKLL